MGWLRDRRAYTADLSAIVVQAGAADRLVDRDAGAAKATLASIRRPGPRDLPSLRQLVGVVRESDEAGRRAPQPTLGGWTSWSRRSGWSPAATAWPRPR